MTAITNIQLLHNQQSVLLFHSSLTTFCTQHKDTGFTLVWSPQVRERSQDYTVMFLPWTGPDCSLTGYDYGLKYIISHGLLISGIYHMYDSDSFLGSLY